MCTVLVNWRPWEEKPFVAGANRDEDPTRPSEPFALRGDILCPLDVRGGTWVGVNRHGLFAALTNWDKVKRRRGMQSRGDLVLSALKHSTAAQASRELLDRSMQGAHYNGFHLILADRESLWVASGDGSRIQAKAQPPGLHLLTGKGFNPWSTRRGELLRKNLSFPQALQAHSNSHPEDSVCVHDPRNRWGTRSSCVITADEDWNLTVEECDGRPCENWANRQTWHLERTTT